MVRIPSDYLRKHIPIGSTEAYIFAIFCVVVAALIRWAIGLAVAGVVPFAAFFPAALFAAFVGGMGPGIFAVVLGGIIGWWAFLEPKGYFLPLTLSQQVSLVFYFATGLIIVVAADHYRKVTKRLEDAERFRELAVEELAHRLKNKVATIQAIISLRLRDDPDSRDEILNCLSTLRATDELIIATQGRGGPHFRYPGDGTATVRRRAHVDRRSGDPVAAETRVDGGVAVSRAGNEWRNTEPCLAILATCRSAGRAPTRG
jgi:hypothetical protein